ncbi:MAG: D-alanyl-D-alanine carboxypeptidase [Proteobacteria bacterium]|nr:D-alanyl-D-alanine carboxypeptidase [Pseudomonadota bacterium]
MSVCAAAAFAWTVAATTDAQAAVVETVAPQAILIDLATGSVLMEKDSDQIIEPASMSKLMLIYMLFERLADGGLTMDDTLPVSETAWRMGGSKMFVGVNTRVTVSDLLRGIIVQSGNDACIVVAEALASSELAFAQMMTERGIELGLRNSVFKNSTGWPADGHVMTAADIARLAERIIRDFPQYYSMFAETSFTYNEIRQSNRNPLLYSYAGADGLKTGHTESAGYGLVGSATRNGRRLVLVVTGLENEQQRAREAERLLDWGFREFANYALFRAGEVVADAPLWLGDTATVPLVIQNDLTLTMSRAARRQMTVTAEYQGPIPAPIQSGQQVATLVIEAPDTETIRLPLYAGADVGRLGLVGRLGAALNYLVWGAAQTAAP